MASVKAEKAVGTQLFGQAKKDPAPKPGDNATAKAPASKSGAKKAAPKPQEPKKKVYIYIYTYITCTCIHFPCGHAILNSLLLKISMHACNSR